VGGLYFSSVDSYWSIVAYPKLTKSLCAVSIIDSETHWIEAVAAKRFIVPASTSQAFFSSNNAKKIPITFKAKIHEMMTNICKIVAIFILGRCTVRKIK
jgi:hypothetical protein